MKPIPHTCFSTRLSGSARETEGRLRSLLRGGKKRPPAALLILLVLLIALCGSLVACQPGAEDAPAGNLPPAEQYRVEPESGIPFMSGLNFYIDALRFDSDAPGYQAINAYFENLVSEFSSLEFQEDSANPSTEEDPYFYYTLCSLLSQDDRYVCVQISTTYYLGGALGREGEFVTFDVEIGQPLTLEELTGLTEQELTDQISTWVLNSDYSSWWEPDQFSYDGSSFYLDDGQIFYLWYSFATVAVPITVSAPSETEETPQPLAPPADAAAAAAVPGTSYLLYLQPEGDGLALYWTSPDYGGGQPNLLLTLAPASSVFPYAPGDVPSLTPFSDILGRPGVVLGTTTDSGVPVQWYYRGDDYGVQLMAAAQGETWTAQLDGGAEELLCLSGDGTLELWSRRDNDLLVYAPVSRLAGRLFPDAGGQTAAFTAAEQSGGDSVLFDARYTGADGREVTRQVSGEVLTQSLWPALSVSTPAGDTVFFWGEGEAFSSAALSVRTPDGTVRQLLEYFLDPGYAQLPLYLESLGLAPEAELFATVTDDPVVRATYFDNGVVNHAFWAADDRGEPVQLALLDDTYFHADLNGDGRDEVFSLAAEPDTPEGQYLFFYLYTYPEEGGVRFASPPDVLARSQGADYYDYLSGGGGLAQLYVEYDPEALRFSFFHMDTGQPAAQFTGRELYDLITEQGMWADGDIPASGDFGRAAA